MSKLNVLVVPSDNIGGVGFYRSTQPHIKLEQMYPDDFSVTIDMNPDWKDLEGFKKYNLIHIHKGLFQNFGAFRAALAYFKENNIVTVMDIDDSWSLSPHHPQYASHKIYKIDEMIKENMRLFDYVTTTTPIFAKEIEKFNKNVVVLPNAIDPEDPRFAVNKKPSDKLRIGLIMGSSHEYDVMLLNDICNGLPQEILDKVQFVLCGFDLRGSMKEINAQTKEVRERPIEPKETVWYRYEKMLTNNYKTVSPEYRQFLEMFLINVDYPNADNEHYKRCWTKDMNHYYEHFSQVDVLLAPIEPIFFNKVKSQLKVIECAFSKTAIVASDFGPYTIDLKNAIEKGGGINPEGNAILIDEGKNHKDWKKAVIRLVKSPELVKQLQENLAKDICKDYNLATVTEKRAQFYKDAVYLKYENQNKETTKARLATEGGFEVEFNNTPTQIK